MVIHYKKNDLLYKDITCLWHSHAHLFLVVLFLLGLCLRVGFFVLLFLSGLGFIPSSVLVAFSVLF